MSLVEVQTYFETELARFRESRYAGDDGVLAATRYALSGTGKRVRPILCLLSARALGADPRTALAPALALEMIHTYSLVHDDLPCMDDDALRRGRPSTHVVHGDALALLAGDALLTDAFTLLADAPRAGDLVRELGGAAGGLGMVQGQALDLYWTARQGASRETLDTIHRLKTGRLLGAACALGAIAGGGDPEVVGHFRDFGQRVGHAFQIRDDLLDDMGGTGKSIGKDKEVGKLTYLALMSRSDAETAARELTEAAMALLSPHGMAAEPLRTFALGLLTRQR